PDWLRARLARRADAPADPGTDLPRAPGPPAALALGANACGAFAARRATLAREQRHGDWLLEEIGSADAEALALAARDPGLGGFDLERALYLDIETTGLAGGAGTYPFLIGLGAFAAQGFELWQGFLRGPEEERALLSEVAARVRAAGALVTFF